MANGEGTNVISGQPDLSTAADITSPVGAYAIVVGLGSLSASNYSFSLTNGTLTVGKALLTVTADNQERLYGQTNPVFTVQYSGFVDGDTQSVLSGAPSLEHRGRHQHSGGHLCHRGDQWQPDRDQLRAEFCQRHLDD